METQLTYATYETHEHGYTKTHVVVREMYKEETAEALEGTVDNKAGYGTEQAAVLQGHRFQAVLDAGHETHYSSTCMGLDVHLVWQHYQKDEDGTQLYCDVSYQHLGRSFNRIQEAMRFLQNVGRSIERAKAARHNENATFQSGVRKVANHTFDRPEDLLAALRRMKKSVQVTHDRALETWVRADQTTNPKAA